MRATAASTILIVLILLGTVIVPGVLAQDYKAQQSRQIDLAPTAAFPTDKTVNLAKIGSPSETQLEKDVLVPQFMEVGRFLGPYIRSSKFHFTNNPGATLEFNATFKFTPEQVMAGASEYWIRWPIVPAQYDILCVEIENFFRGPFDFEEIPYTRCVNPGNRAGTPTFAPAGATFGDWAIYDDSGLYIKEFSWLFPDHPYHFHFLGYLKAGESPAVWVSIEKYQVESNVTYHFNDPLRDVSHSETLPLYPAFAFNFLSGLGDDGMTSYLLPFDGKPTTFLYQHVLLHANPAGTGLCSDHVSLYLPFGGNDAMTFHIFINHSAWFEGPGSNAFLSDAWTIPDTRQFLLTSSPLTIGQIYSLAGISCTNPHDAGVWTIFIYADKPVVLLGYATSNRTDDITFTKEDPVPRFAANDGTPWGSALLSVASIPTFTAHDLPTPIFLSAQQTSGAWAAVSIGKYFATYDFGWGKAYLFPGEVNLTMFLKDGRAIGFTSISPILSSPDAATGAQGCQGLFQNVTGAFQPVAEWIGKLACFIVSLVGDVIGTISTIFQTIWNGIKQIGEWLYNALVGFVDTIVKIATAIIDVATQIVFSLLAAFPFIFILFVTGKGLPDVLRAKREIKRGIRKAKSRKGLVYRPARKAIAGGRRVVKKVRDVRFEREARRYERLDDEEQE